MRWRSPETVGGCEAKVYLRGKDVKVNPMGCQAAAAAAASLRLGLVLSGLCIAWLLFSFSSANNFARVD